MGENINDLINKIRDEAFQLKLAKSSGTRSDIAERKERMKNILLNNVDAIVEALSTAAEAEERIKLLETELDDADKELDEKDALIRELKSGSQGKGKKKGGVEAVETEEAEALTPESVE